MVIQHNMIAMNANRMGKLNNAAFAKTVEKLSSGYRVNRAADNAAGLAISEKLRRQVRGLTQASRNAQDGISLLQIGDGAMNEIHDMLQRMNELSVQAANDTLAGEDRDYIQSEVQALKLEIDRVGLTTTFNTIRILNGIPQESTITSAPSGLSLPATVDQATDTHPATMFLYDFDIGDTVTLGSDTFVVGNRTERIYDDDEHTSYTDYINKSSLVGRIASAFLHENILSNDVSGGSLTMQPVTGGYEISIRYEDPLELSLHVGAEKDQTINLTIDAVNTGSLGISMVNVDGADPSNAENSIELVKEAISRLNRQRSYFGAMQNRLEHTIGNLDNVVENTTASESQIRDTDMARLVEEMAKRQLLSQVSDTMLAQANQNNSMVLNLLQ